LETFGKGLAVLLYILVMLGIGWWSMRRTKNVGDFFIGGRTIGPWVSAMAYGTTYFSAVLFVGFAGKIGWGFGMHALWVALGNAVIGTALAWALLATKTREMTERLDAITMPEFLAARYGVSWLKPLSALIIFIFLVPYSAGVYQGLSHLFEVNLGIGYLQAIIFMAALTGVYLVMGGYFAVTLTDMVQGVMQIFGVIVMVLLLAQATGLGVFGSFEQGLLPANIPALNPPPGAPSPLFPGIISLLGLVFMTSVGPMGLPQMVQKFYSIKSRDAIKRGIIIATLFSAIISFSAYYCGGLSHHFYASAADLPQLANGHGPDFDKVTPELLTKYTPAWFSLVVLLVVLAASMSTLSSLVLVSSAAITVDLLGARNRKGQESKHGLLLMRVLCGVFVALSVIMAAGKVGAIVTLMSMSWGALSGSFIGPFVWGILWRRTTPAGAVCGLLCGLITSVGGFVAFGPANAPVAASLGIIVSLVLVPLVSLVTVPVSEKRLARAYGEPIPAEEPAS
jgi:SSS family solute:Na+ symporter